MATGYAYPQFKTGTIVYFLLAVGVIMVLWQVKSLRPLLILLVIIVGLGLIIRFAGPVTTQLGQSSNIISGIGTKGSK